MERIVQIACAILAIAFNILLLLDFIYSPREVDVYYIGFIIKNVVILLANIVMFGGKNVSKTLGLLCYIELIIGVLDIHIEYYSVSPKLFYVLRSGVMSGHTTLYLYAHLLIALMFMFQLIYLVVNTSKSDEKGISFVVFNKSIFLILISAILIYAGMNLETYRKDVTSTYLSLRDYSWYSNYQVIFAFVLLLLIVCIGEGKGATLVSLSIIVIYMHQLVYLYLIMKEENVVFSISNVRFAIYSGIMGIVLLIASMIPGKMFKTGNGVLGRPRGQV